MTSEASESMCKAITKSGEPCRAWPDESGLCCFHRSDHQENCVKGGQHSSLRYRLEKRLSPRLIPILQLLEQSAQEVHDGRLTPAAGSSVAAICGALVRVLESAEYETKLQELENLLIERGLLTE